MVVPEEKTEILAAAEIEVVALGGQTAGDGTGTDGNQGFAVRAKFAQHMDVFCVADAAFDQSDIARPAMLDVGDRRAVEFDQLKQGQDALVDVEKGHMAAEAAGERSGGDAQFLAHASPPISVRPELVEG